MILPGDLVVDIILDAPLLTIDGITRSCTHGHLLPVSDSVPNTDMSSPEVGQNLAFRLLSPFGTLYLPRPDDLVIGRVLAVLPGLAGYRLDIRSFTHALLPSLAFDNVNRRTVASLPVGTYVLARVSFLPSNVGTVELSCLGGLGPLTDPDGRVVELPLSTVRNPPKRLFARLAAKTPFAIRLVANGRAWVTALTLRDTLSVCRSLTSLAS